MERGQPALLSERFDPLVDIPPSPRDNLLPQTESPEMGWSCMYLHKVHVIFSWGCLALPCPAGHGMVHAAMDADAAKGKASRFNYS